jgi:nucleoside-diphosphate-sugar epimerase
MRVFVTGATGLVGSALVRDLLDAGHQVLGLARSDEAAAAVQNAGAQVHRGSLADLESLRSGAAAADGVVHTAFIHDFSNFIASVETDRRVVETFGEALAGSDRPLVVTSGTGMLPPGRPSTEEDAPGPDAHSPRAATEAVALAFAERGVRVSVVRLPPSVHSEADKTGFVPMHIGIARSKGFVPYVGDGSNRWATVHQLDAARVFRLAVESAPAGSRLHAIGEQGVPFREIAEAIGRHLNMPTRSISAQEAAELGFLGGFLSMDLAAESSITRKLLGWEPVHAGLIEDLDAGRYSKET